MDGPGLTYGPFPLPPQGPMLGPPAPSGPRYSDVWGPQSSPHPGRLTGEPTPQLEAAPASSAASSFLAAGAITIGAVGAYYGAVAQQNSLRGQGINLDHRSAIGLINARALEAEADRIMESTARSLMGLGLQRATERGNRAGSISARGGTVAKGSSAETMASWDYGAMLERYTISANAVRQREAARTAALSERVQSSLDQVSADNMRGAANAINPYAQALGSAIQMAAMILL